MEFLYLIIIVIVVGYFSINKDRENTRLRNINDVRKKINIALASINKFKNIIEELKLEDKNKDNKVYVENLKKFEKHINNANKMILKAMKMDIESDYTIPQDLVNNALTELDEALILIDR